MVLLCMTTTFAARELSAAFAGAYARNIRSLREEKDESEFILSGLFILPSLR
jgi:hypothetical protein